MMKLKFACCRLRSFPLLLVALVLLVLPTTITALFAEDAGVMDFRIATTGHGVTRFAQLVAAASEDENSNELEYLVTSDVGNTGMPSSSCYVATRNASNGNVLWRRNVCSVASSSSEQQQQSHALAVVSSSFVVTMDHQGVVQSWRLTDGHLIWETNVQSSSSHPQVWETEKDGQTFVAVGSGLVLDPATGRQVDGVRAGSASPPSDNKKMMEASCPGLLQVSIHKDRLSLSSGSSSSSSSLSFTGDEFLPDGDDIAAFVTLSCSDNTSSMNALLSTASGTTTSFIFTLDTSSNQVSTRVAWTAEEGLSSVSSAVFLDASHMGVDDLNFNFEQQSTKNSILQETLSLSSRLWSQLDEILSLVRVSDNSSSELSSVDDHTFGFVKVLSLLSQKAHRVWGMSTSGSNRGDILWSVDLPKNAEWHRLVHGTTNAPKATHGINGGTHSREILVLSATPSSMEWTCVDGTNGVVNAEGSTPIYSKVAQVIPIFGASELCRQAAVLLLEDESIVLVPTDDQAEKLVADHIASSSNGVYTHSIDEKDASLSSFRIAANPDGSFSTIRVGQTSFSGEKILKVSYPVRDEVIHSMSTILGDNSLLLKYLNPHMAMVVTATQKDETKRGDLSSAVGKKEGKSKKRKPVGAGESSSSSAVVEEASSAVEIPNMFVNLVDTISGRILHRVSHINVDVTKPIAATITENWVVYSFTNQKTRRTELGVLTLHEGMIDSKGLTFFSSPEQSTTFSSFDTRESKPVVLSKLYTYPKAITALGTTLTRAGISNKRIVIASADGKISMVDRKMLETRRPTGDVRDAEKAEGLYQ